MYDNPGIFTGVLPRYAQHEDGDYQCGGHPANGCIVRCPGEGSGKTGEREYRHARGGLQSGRTVPQIRSLLHVMLGGNSSGTLSDSAVLSGFCGRPREFQENCACKVSTDGCGSLPWQCLDLKSSQDSHHAKNATAACSSLFLAQYSRSW